MSFSGKRYIGAVFLSLLAVVNPLLLEADEIGFQSGLHNTGSVFFSSGPDKEPAEKNASWRKWEKVPVRPLSVSPGSSSASSLPAEWFIRFFQEYISPVDGASCTFCPSCSAYGLQAIRRNGLLLGIPMTAERIMRNHHPDNPERYPMSEKNGNLYYSDPVGANDFWWHVSP